MSVSNNSHAYVCARAQTDRSEARTFFLDSHAPIAVRGRPQEEHNDDAADPFRILWQNIVSVHQYFRSLVVSDDNQEVGQ